MTSRKPIKLPSRDRLLELFTYNAETGQLFHRARGAEMFRRAQDFKAWNTRFAGKPAGHVNPEGYVHVKLDGKLLKAHRVMYKIVTGREPENNIDHLNGDTTDNRFENLRDVTQADNNKNCFIQANNSSGFNGVNFYPKLQKWCASGRLNKKRIHIGYFDTPEAAYSARLAWQQAHGYTERHGEVIP